MVKKCVIDDKIEKFGASIGKIKKIIANRNLGYEFSASKAQWKTFMLDNNYKECIKCGYNKCPNAIDMHHIGNKTFEIASWITSHGYNNKNIGILKIELAKCIPLCSNCHRELHYNDRIKHG